MNNIRKQYLEFCPLQGNLLEVLADPSPHNIRDIIVPQENRKEPATILHLTLRPVAQLVEHRVVVWEDVSSTPARPTFRVLKNN